MFVAVSRFRSVTGIAVSRESGNPQRVSRDRSSPQSVSNCFQIVWPFPECLWRSLESLESDKVCLDKVCLEFLSASRVSPECLAVARESDSLPSVSGSLLRVVSLRNVSDNDQRVSCSLQRARAASCLQRIAGLSRESRLSGSLQSVSGSFQSVSGYLRRVSGSLRQYPDFIASMAVSSVSVSLPNVSSCIQSV